MLDLWQALFSEAWQSLQMDLSPPDALMGHRALHISAQLAQQARAAAEGTGSCPSSYAPDMNLHSGLLNCASHHQQGMHISAATLPLNAFCCFVQG